MESFANRSTRELLGRLATLRMCLNGGWLSDDEFCDLQKEKEFLKQELSTRPHIPNKEESRDLRKSKKHAGTSNKKNSNRETINVLHMVPRRRA